MALRNEAASSRAQRDQRDQARLNPAPSIPTVEHLPIEIDAAERQRIAALAGKLLADEPRWGGTSIPMTAANRLVGDWRRRPFVVLDQRTAEPGPERELAEFLQEIGSDLFVPGIRHTGAVVLAPGRIEAGTGLALMVLGETTAAARTQAEEIVARLGRN